MAASRAVAGVEGMDRVRLVVLEEFVEAEADDSTDTMLPVPERLREADAEGNDDPRLFVPRNPVGEDSVMYAIDEAFPKVTT